MVRLCPATCVLSAAIVAAYECDPKLVSNVPTNRLEGESCGGWCGTAGSCAAGLHCDDGLLPLAFMPFGLKLDTVCRSAAHDDALWHSIKLVSCSPGWRLMSLADADDLDKAASVASNAIMATPALQFDPCVRILTAKACGDTRYALLVQRIYEDAGATQFYLVEDRGDRPALPTATPVHLHAAA